ncbi:MAG: hypothetical protein ACJAUD_002528 [Crocinitomicaceae bacterium]|jgi:hypothetical protein
MNKIGKYILIVVIAAFALLTLFSSSSVIFDWFEIRAKEGNYVLFVVWANFISSILYLTSVCGLIKKKKWVVKPLLLSGTILILAQVGLFLHIDAGGIYETKTVGAMFFRIALTFVFALFTYLTNRRVS